MKISTCIYPPGPTGHTAVKVVLPVFYPCYVLSSQISVIRSQLSVVSSQFNVSMFLLCHEYAKITVQKYVSSNQAGLFALSNSATKTFGVSLFGLLCHLIRMPCGIFREPPDCNWLWCCSVFDFCFYAIFQPGRLQRPFTHHLGVDQVLHRDQHGRQKLHNFIIIGNLERLYKE